MRLLIANELYECGGAENVFRDEVQLCLNAGFDVRTITFDPNFIKSEFPDHHNYPIDGGALGNCVFACLATARLGVIFYNSLRIFSLRLSMCITRLTVCFLFAVLLVHIVLGIHQLLACRLCMTMVWSVQGRGAFTMMDQYARVIALRIVSAINAVLTFKIS